MGKTSESRVGRADTCQTVQKESLDITTTSRSSAGHQKNSA
uniref:Uncharacterized protein n=1 Tax=Setaria italica TaxID=4555 RepID=K3ZG34_SETIT